MPHATEADAREAYAGPLGPAARLRAVMSAAAGTVARIAPPPELAEGETEPPADYVSRAADAELLAGAWYWSTGGFVDRHSVFESSTQYQVGDIPPGVERAIVDTMGEYGPGAFGPPSGTGPSQVTVLSSFAGYEEPYALPTFNQWWPDGTGWPIT